MDKLREYERSTPLRATTSVPSFQEATPALGGYSNLLGELGADMAMSAAMKRAEIRGYELGQNPQGDLLPPISEFDKTLVQSYNTQSAATLGLQAQSLFENAQNEVQKAWRVSPELINQYQQNVAGGLQSILDAAPTGVRQQLQNQFASHLMRTTNQLNSKLISQQKQDTRDKISLYNQTQAQNIFESSLTGDLENAKASLDELIESNRVQRETGIISPLQEKASNDAATQTYLSGKYIQGAIAAKSTNDLEAYLSDFANNRPQDLNFEQWQKVGRSMLSYLQSVDSLEARDKSLMMAQLNRGIIDNSITPDVIAEAESKLSPTEFTNFMARYDSARQKSQSSNTQANDVIASWTDTDVMSQAPTKTKNQAFFQATQQLLRQEPQLTPFQAQTSLALAAGSEIPAYTNDVAGRMLSGNPTLMFEAAEAYDKINELKPQNLASLPTNARAMHFAFESQLRQGRLPEEAAAIARENVFGQTEEMKKSNDEAWRFFRRTNLSERRQQLNFVQSIVNTKAKYIRNQDALIHQVMGAYESNFKLVNGDEAAAKQMTIDGFAKTYGDTFVNGDHEFAFLPIEKIAGLGDNSAGVIQADIVSQLAPQLEGTKKGYDDGLFDFYYRLAPRIATEEIKAKQDALALFKQQKGELADMAKSDARGAFAKAREYETAIDNFLQGAPITVEKVWRNNQIEQYQVAIEASPLLALSHVDANPVLGDYDIRLKSANGRYYPLIGMGNLVNQNPVYRPNLNALNKTWAALTGMSMGAGKTTQQLVDEYMQKSKQQSASPSILESPNTLNAPLF